MERLSTHLGIKREANIASVMKEAAKEIPPLKLTREEAVIIVDSEHEAIIRVAEQLSGPSPA
jgi:hypothetical protein